ncbi:MAG: MBL fold metallo-hydrolase [Clostridia bacterium]|nr:MBL fold metallo-hydrolase [Clostridia bacterium]
MAKFYPMFSSSKGNCIYIGDENGGVLVDAGVSFKRMEGALAGARLSLSDIKGVLITHEHTDHICGLKTLLKKVDIPVIASRETIYALEFLKIINSDTKRIYAEDSVDLDGINITRFATSHDCNGSSGYVVELPTGTKGVVCTDLGVMTEEILEKISNSDIVMLESNHDPVMLRMGPYTPELKLRVASDKGHLSNAVCADTIAKLYKSGCYRFVLGHLSENNNTPQKAEAATRAALFDAGAKADDYILYIAPKENGKVIAL